MKQRIISLVSARKITNFSGPIFRLLRYTLLCFFLFAIVFKLAAQPKTAKKIKLPNVLNEVSGLYIEDLQSFWWHNDSSNPPILFRTDSLGNIQEKIQLDDWKNRDWEDITADKSGNIYIGDFGNNCNCRTNLKIYIYNPTSGNLDFILFSLGDQTLFPPNKEAQNFDLEGFFWHDNQLHLFSKNTLSKGGNWECKHYVIPAEPGTYVAQVSETIKLPNRVVTGAAISPDGSSIALISYRFKKLLGFIPFSQASVFEFRNFEGTSFFEGDLKKHAIPPYIIATQFESIDFIDPQTVYVASERTVFIRPKAKRLKLK